MENNHNEKNLEELEQAAETQEVETQEVETQEAEPREEPAPAPEQPKKPKKGRSIGAALRSNKFKRGGMATVMSVVFIAIVVVVNILMGILTDRFPSMNIDLTAQKLNSLSDQALDVAKGVEQETKIYLIGSEDAYRKNQVYSSYGFQYSQVANLAEKLREANSLISVEFVDPDTNPAFISEYSEDNLTTGKVLIKTEKRHKVLGVSDLFSLQQSSTTGGYDSYSKVDSALAGALEMVNLDKVPVVAVATGHGELLNSDTSTAFRERMEAENFEIREFDFLTEEIPEETQILMLPTPTTDYTEEELQKLREYLDDETRTESVSVLVTCHPTQGELPNLAGFLEEWGVKVEPGVVGETDSSRMALRSGAYVLVDHDEEVLSENEYNTLLAVSSAPLTLLFNANGDVGVRALWTTADTAYVATEDMTEADMESVDTSSQTVAAMATKTVSVDGKNASRSVVVFGSSYIFTDTFMEASAFSNRAYITDLMKYVTNTDGSAVSVTTETVQTNVVDVTAPISVINLLGLGVFTIGLPVVILVAGLVIFLKRRHL